MFFRFKIRYIVTNFVKVFKSNRFLTLGCKNPKLENILSILIEEAQLLNKLLANIKKESSVSLVFCFNASYQFIRFNCIIASEKNDDRKSFFFIENNVIKGRKFKLNLSLICFLASSLSLLYNPDPINFGCSIYASLWHGVMHFLYLLIIFFLCYTKVSSFKRSINSLVASAIEALLLCKSV